MANPNPQTVYGSNNPPGGGNPFFAGLEEIFSSPVSAIEDYAAGSANIVSLGTVNPSGGSWVPQKNAAGGAQPGAGFAFLAGTEELFNDPGQAASDAASAAKDALGGLPGSGTVTTWLVVGAIGLVAAAYIAHKAL